ncbi:hypothetical protein [Alteribacter aurantiacus]|uniref:hypothetical protein n=1 Tax=Alteribacter aurantiacus TaxID=254410 RepID=UPI00040695D8|nr:hypothetical protein [Alteribacter aurantiacus]
MQIDMKKSIKVGIITPVEHLEFVQSNLDYFPSIKPVWYLYSSETEESRVIEESINNKETEALLFLEHHVYKSTINNKKLSIPAHFIAATGNNIYRTAFLLFNNNEIKNICCDPLPLINLPGVLADLGITLSSVHVVKEKSEEKTIEEHKEFLENHKNAGSITSRVRVAEELKRQGLCCEYVMPTPQDLMVTLERILLSTKSRENLETQFVCGFIKGKYINFDEQIHFEVEKQIHTFVKQLNGIYQQVEEDFYMFVTNRGSFERVTRGYKSIPFLNQGGVCEKYVKFNMGVGFGNSVKDAKNHGRIAFNHTKGFPPNKCFIVNDDKQVFGPVEMTRHLVYDIAITDYQLLEKAKVAGMTASYISRLIAQLNHHEKGVYSAQELANIFGITLRSTHRNLSKWLDADIVKIVGEEKTAYRGRPRTIYSFDWLKDLR